jgi:hypothetical protein
VNDWRPPPLPLADTFRNSLQAQRPHWAWMWLGWFWDHLLIVVGCLAAEAHLGWLIVALWGVLGRCGAAWREIIRHQIALNDSLIALLDTQTNDLQVLDGKADEILTQLNRRY